MCIAIVKPKGVKMPSKDILKICFKNNPDGSGFSYNRNGKNYIHKGYFTFADFYNDLLKCKIKDNESALIHFRVATHGSIDKSTCHPFLITQCYDDMKKTHIKTQGNIIIHNGMLHLYDEDNTISDSMVLAKNLYSLDLNKTENKLMIQLALQNNDKNKTNRMAILYNNGQVQLFGWKTKWENVDGCYYSNKSYEKEFTRNNKKVLNIQEKFNYDENQIQSSKISFCSNKQNGCDQIAKFIVFVNEKQFYGYCDKCIKRVKFFTCQCCNNSYIKDCQSKHKKICIYCYKEYKQFLQLKNCTCGEKTSKKIYLNQNDTIYKCESCSIQEHVFKCGECKKIYSKNNLSSIKNLCKYCYSQNKIYKCFFCSEKNNLNKTMYSIVCDKCLKEKEAKRCYICDNIYIYGKNKIGNLNICSECGRIDLDYKSILNKYDSFKLLSSDKRDQLIKLIKNTTQDIIEQIIINYSQNDYFDQINSNYCYAKNLITYFKK